VSPLSTYFLPYQARWIRDQSPLKIVEKSRQIGFSYADSYDSVIKVAPKNARLDVYVSSRDQTQAMLYLRYCKRWATVLKLAAQDLGQVLIDRDKDLAAFCLKFANGLAIYSLSSNPDAIAGKTGHIKLDEFALHKDQRELYRIAKPCTQWGGQLAVISTHRGHATVFNEIITAIRENGNPMGWSHHRVTLQDAVNEGLVEKINQANGGKETREAFLARTRAECLDEEQWLQEYCCIPADDSTAFITYEMIHACESPGVLKGYNYITSSPSPLNGERAGVRGETAYDPRTFYLGVDVARKQHLCVLDVGERIGDVTYDRLRIELQNKTFAEIEHELWRLLELPQVKRCCIDATGLGMQLAERAQYRFGWKVEPITFTAPVKEQLAFQLRAAFEDRTLRLDPDPKLRADLRAIKKEVTLSGNIRFVGESEDSHCDRFWAKALRHHAAQYKPKITATVID
jgi:phage FluMu gp28-like protein